MLADILCPEMEQPSHLLYAKVLQGRTSGHQRIAGSTVSNKQNYKLLTRLVGEQRSKMKSYTLES